MGTVIILNSQRPASNSHTLETEKRDRLLTDLKIAIGQLNKIDAELANTQKKLAFAQKRAQWATHSIENLRALCIHYIKHECQLEKGRASRQIQR